MVDTNETNEKVQVLNQINESKSVTEESKVEDRLKENNVTASEVSLKFYLIVNVIFDISYLFWGHFGVYAGI